MFNVAELMTTELHTLSPDDSLSRARQVMLEKSIRHIPIVDSNSTLLGILTHRDLLAAKATDAHQNQTSDDWQNTAAIANHMIAKVNTIDENMSMRGAALQMQQQKIGCLPVIRNNELVGIVTDSDFVGLAINLLEQLEEVQPIEDDS